MMKIGCLLKGIVRVPLRILQGICVGALNSQNRFWVISLYYIVRIE